ncbi:putative spermidine/putrescine transport system permease protein [Chelatococcus asaccharovorans]|uniref:Putative spermidine/putrescine transport system permease protein n=2 Tax=Chelatococcus asaccharovorans TaxID=28210 RepID=A0A2V3TSD4_9HYPH|nr:putative spermidine/putrescine transport system permease protein [Chelatococcus asaccharovorans]
MRNGPLSLTFHLLLVVFLLAPLVVVIMVAFTPGMTLEIPLDSFSLRWLEAVFHHPDFVASFWTSLWLALASGTLSVLLAIPAALAIARSSFPGRDAINGLLLSPLLIPHLVLGVAILRLLTVIGETGSFFWLLLSHTVVVSPYALRLILAAISGMDESAEQAAYSLGASRWTVFRRITFPMILPGITGGWLLAFITSFDELTMSIFVTSPSTVTLPVRMYMYASETLDPMMAAVSALMILITGLAMILLDRVYGLDRVLVGER